MKTLMIIATITVISVSTFFKANATGDNETNLPYSVSITEKSSDKYDLIFTSESTKNVKIKITNEKGQHLRMDYVKKGNSFKLPYDFSNMPEGKYIVNVSTGKHHYSTTINHVKEAAPFFNAFIEKEEGNKFRIKVVRHSKNPVIVTFYNKNNQIIYTETIDVDYNFERLYKLSLPSLKANSITVHSGSQSKTYIVN